MFWNWKSSKSYKGKQTFEGKKIIWPSVKWEPSVQHDATKLYKLSTAYLLRNFVIPYARHHNPQLIRNRSWILTIHKTRILRKKPLEKTFLDFKKWVKSIQTAGYNGARTFFFNKYIYWNFPPVHLFESICTFGTLEYTGDVLLSYCQHWV